MNWRVALELGRVSNLPSVWTNVLAGAVLSGGSPSGAMLAVLALAASFFYVGGMFLNDAFDRHVDARERLERPIPSGRAAPGQVFAAGFGLLAVGLATLASLAAAGTTPRFWPPVLAGASLGALIVLYDWRHKANPLSALLMGSCRVAVYVMAALSVGTLNARVGEGALALFAYVVGLTFVARSETRSRIDSVWPLALLALAVGFPWPLRGGAAGAALALMLLAWVVHALSFLSPRRGPRIPRAVMGLIAGISLLDARLIALEGALGLACLAAAGAALTRVGQRRVSGT